MRVLYCPRENPYDRCCQDSINSNPTTPHTECWYESGKSSPIPLPWTKCPRDVRSLEGINDCSLSLAHHILDTAQVYRLHSGCFHSPLLYPPYHIPGFSYLASPFKVQSLHPGSHPPSWEINLIISSSFKKNGIFPNKRSPTSKPRVRTLHTLIRLSF